jgi:hypothetical protein
MYNTKTFTEVFDTYSDFKTEYTSTQKFPMVIDATDTESHVSNLQILYYLLYAKYGNSPIANYDENQFKTKMGAIIWQYGPTWEKKVEIQSTLRSLTENQIKTGISRAISNTGTVGTSGSNTYNNLTSTDSGQDIHNHAYNPATDPTTQTTIELNYINEQHVDKFGKTNTMSGSVANSNTQTNNLSTSDATTIGILDSYSELWALLVQDVTDEFLSKFGPLFQKAINLFPYLYESED